MRYTYRTVSDAHFPDNLLHEVLKQKRANLMRRDRLPATFLTNSLRSELAFHLIPSDGDTRRTTGMTYRARRKVNFMGHARLSKPDTTSKPMSCALAQSAAQLEARGYEEVHGANLTEWFQCSDQTERELSYWVFDYWYRQLPVNERVDMQVWQNNPFVSEAYTDGSHNWNYVRLFVPNSKSRILYLC